MATTTPTSRTWRNWVKNSDALDWARLGLVTVRWSIRSFFMVIGIMTVGIAVGMDCGLSNGFFFMGWRLAKFMRDYLHFLR
jgi:hypothetical protein